MSDSPLWDTASIYIGFSDPRYLADQALLKHNAARLLKLLKTFPAGKDQKAR